MERVKVDENQKNKVSVVIPAYNRERYIAACIDSVLHQTYKNIEIICIDDGSIDKTGEIIREIGKVDTRLRIISQMNGGVSRARNVGIEEATGDYIMFVDSDDYLDPTMVFKLLTTMLQGSSEMAICGYYECLNKGRNEHCLIPDGEYSVEEYLGYFIDAPFNSCFGGPMCKLVKRVIFGYEDVAYEEGEILAEDFIFNTKMLRHIKKVSAVHECLYFFRRYSEDSLSKQKHEWAYARRRGHIMIREFHELFRVWNMEKRFQDRLREYDVQMLRFLVSHLMVSEEVCEAEKRREFFHIMDQSTPIINFPPTYKGLSRKSAIILFLHKHKLYGIAKKIYS